MEIIFLKGLITKDWKIVLKKSNTVPLHIGAFVLPNGKRSMKIFIQAINGFLKNHFYYTDTDSLYIENKY